MTTEVMKDISIISKISNETRFNTDEFSAWRSAFRECVKLSYHLKQNPYDWQAEEKLMAWTNTDLARPFTKQSLMGAADAVEFVEQHTDNLKILLKVNDRKWLKNQFINKHSS